MKDTYGNELTSDVPEWKSFQKRNDAIRDAAVKMRAKFSPPNTGESTAAVTVSRIHFFADGVKLAGSLWMPKKRDDTSSSSTLPPALLLAHGWGGLKDHLDVRYAPHFAQEGFVVLTFDYRGWGDSDGTIVMCKDGDNVQTRARTQDSTKQLAETSSCCEIRVARQTIDMTWQLADIDAALSFLCGLRGIGKIGIWGTSQGGGHVIEIAGRDHDRVDCVVSQVPSMGRHGAGAVTSSQVRQRSLIQAQNASHFPIPWFPIPREFHFPAMDGGPVLRRLFWYDPLLRAHNITCPLLVIDSEKEELWDRHQNGKRAFDIVHARLGANLCEYELLMGADHYDAYGKRADEARGKALRFFKKHLMDSNNNSVTRRRGMGMEAKL